MTEKEIEQDIEEKKDILKWMVSKKYFDVDQVGKIVSNYYMSPDEVVESARAGKDWVF
jgi:spore coat protein CotF